MPRTPVVPVVAAGPVPQLHIPGAVTPASSSGHISITVPHVLFMAEGSLYHLDEQNVFVYEKYNIYKYCQKEYERITEILIFVHFQQLNKS
jgi:hypothetical protein